MSDGDQLTIVDVQRGLESQPVFEPLADPSMSETEEHVGVLRATRGDAERLAIITALERTENNRTAAARLLNISRRTLYYKLSEYGLLR